MVFVGEFVMVLLGVFVGLLVTVFVGVLVTVLASVGVPTKLQVSAVPLLPEPPLTPPPVAAP